jgi:LacI family transcriptional regulator
MRPDSGYYRGVLRGINAYAAQARNWVFGMAAQTSDLPLMLQTWRPAGVLAFTYINEEPKKLATLGIPVVSFANIDSTLPLPMVGVDDVAVGRMAAEHLLDRGFRHFAFVGCPLFDYSNQRQSGFDQVLKEAAFPCQLFHDPTPPNAASVWAWMPDPTIQQWLMALPRPIGIFAANDAIGLRVSELCRQLGLRIPEDIALLGVDDDDLFCALAHPQLSSIKTPLERIGYEAARLLDGLVNGNAAEKPGGQPILLPPVGVVTRRSTDILAIDDADLAAAIRLIQDNAHRPVGIRQLMRQVPLSRRSLERKFQAALRRSPLEELIRVRLQRAKDLLSGTDLPIWAVAEQSGFGAHKRLSMMFHKKVGLTPRAYRRQYRLHDESKNEAYDIEEQGRLSL